MNRIAALVLLALAACAQPSAEAFPEIDRPLEQLPRTLWLEPGQLGWSEQQTWGQPLPEGLGFVYVEPEAFLANCNAVLRNECSTGTLGFVEYGIPGLSHDRIWLRGDLSGDRLHATLLHEMGHVLRGEGGHIAEEGFVMSALETGLLQPRPEDYDFVLAGAEKL